MDLEGIGALAAAGVALIGIPTAVLVGRWQLKAALRTAEATADAGMAQAQAAYRAAVDAVRAEARAAQEQWHRGTRREAYASFLLAAHRLLEGGRRFAADSAEELPPGRAAAEKSAADEARAALRAAQTIIELEGPDEVAAPAAGMVDAAQEMARHLWDEAVYARAWGKLVRLDDDPARAVGAAAEQLIEALLELRALHRRQGATGAEASDTEPGAAERNRARRSCVAAREACLAGAFEDEEFDALLAGHSPLPPTFGQGYVTAAEGFADAEVRFVRAAKVELHRPAA
ncbi:hypothetical protein [Streptomyces sp. cg35]|uniref:hypothetical protein n=1 Tax=Streptomyces sp. cg35 TaxID=3421650 RepID=UPI003D1745A7